MENATGFLIDFLIKNASMFSFEYHEKLKLLYLGIKKDLKAGNN